MAAHHRNPKCVQASEGLHFSAMGELLTYKATAADTGGAYSLAVETTPPGGGLPLHVHHNEDEAMYVLEGTFEIECGARHFVAGPGTFIFLPRDVPNSFRNVSAALGKTLYITSPGGFESFLTEIATAKPDSMGTVIQKHGLELLAH